MPLSASHRKYGLEGDVVDECREFSNGAHLATSLHSIEFATALYYQQCRMYIVMASETQHINEDVIRA